jgi:hypothetical protein
VTTISTVALVSSCANAGDTPAISNAVSPHAPKSWFFIDPLPFGQNVSIVPYRKLE